MSGSASALLFILFLSSERVKMGLLIYLCQFDFENLGADLLRQHVPSLPPKDAFDNKESLYFHRVSRDVLSLCSFISTNNFKRWAGEGF